MQSKATAYPSYLASAIKSSMLFAAAGLSAVLKQVLMRAVAILPSFTETLFAYKVARDVKCAVNVLNKYQTFSER